MRVKEKKDGVSVHAVSGSHVVLLGMDATNTARKGLLGFSIQRTDHTKNEKQWCRGFRIFEANKDRRAQGTPVSTWDNPVQSFLWGDYTAEMGHKYSYTIIPAYGTPAELDHDRKGPVEVGITTEDQDTGTHAVYFNRGVAASQAYARKFPKGSPDEYGSPAYKWLSRGLEEALLAFISQAKGNKWGLRAAVYEFNHEPVLKAFHAAIDAGADVQIVFDAREKWDKDGNPTGPFQANRAAIKKAGIKNHCIERTQNPSYISHNKFIVLLENGKPTQVWTGSTNITRGGIFGHANVGHAVREPKIAAAYLKYWEQLSQDPTSVNLQAWIEENSPLPGHPLPCKCIIPIFSPRKTLDALKWYAETMKGADTCACLTLAFTLSKPFQEIFSDTRAALNYILFDKEAKNVADKNRLDLRIAIGAQIDDNHLENWYKDLWEKEHLSGLNQHVAYIHTKVLLVDPFGKNPLLISGSANFSDNSTRRNDENMLIIRGDTRVVDIYVTEFMRLFDHFRARTFGQTPSEETHYLTPDDKWTNPYFNPKSTKFRQRELFR
jgi:phosphatidylserine/phosphatidylglycerophosphate/cardiolipin synthase-like enzyme